MNKSASGHSRPMHSAPVLINVCCYSDSDIIVRRSEATLRASKRLMHRSNTARRQKTASRRSLQNPIRCFDRTGQVRAPTTMATVTKQGIRFRQNSNGYFGDTFGLLLDRRSKSDRRSLFERRSPIDRRSSSDRVSTPVRRSTLDRRSSLDRLSSLVIGASPFVTQNRDGC